jgi:hypothetical protein
VVRAAALVVGLVATVGSARADDGRGFWTGDVDAANHVELTLTATAFRCESCAEPRWTDFAMADLAGQQRIVDGLAGFAQVSLLYRGDTGGIDGEADWFAGPVTLGLRQRLALDLPGVRVALVPSVTIPRTAGGGKASTSVAVAHLLRPDASMYPVKVGTGRLALEVALAVGAMVAGRHHGRRGPRRRGHRARVQRARRRHDRRDGRARRDRGLRGRAHAGPRRRVVLSPARTTASTPAASSAPGCAARGAGAPSPGTSATASTTTRTSRFGTPVTIDVTVGARW